MSRQNRNVGFCLGLRGLHVDLRAPMKRRRALLGYRECHLKPDLLLIYRKPGADTLRLARLGSHSELFG